MWCTHEVLLRACKSVNLLEKIILYTPILNLNLLKTVENFHEWTKLNLNWNCKDQIDKIKTTKTKLKSHQNYKSTKCNLPQQKSIAEIFTFRKISFQTHHKTSIHIVSACMYYF